MSTPTPSRDEVSLRESDISRSGLFSRPLFAVVAVLAIFLLLLAAFSNAKVLLDSQRQRLDGISAQAGFDDYLAFYAAGELVLEGRGGDLYDIAAIGAKEEEVAGRPVGGTGSLGFFNPPFVALLFAPLALLPVGVAGVVLFVINCSLVLGVTTALRRMLNIHGVIPAFLAVLGAISLNSVFWLIGHGQLSMLLVTGFLGFFWFQRQGRPELSGVALALLLVKPQMAVLPILVLLWRRDWRALTSFSSIATALVLVSIVVSGPAVLVEYPSFALSSTGWDMEHGVNVERMFGWNGLFANYLSNHSTPHLALTTLATIATVGVVLRSFGRARPASSQFALAFGAMVAGAILINPHIYMQDLVLMVLIVVAGYLETRELGWPVSVWAGISATVWVIQETTDRIFNVAALNGSSLLLIGLLLALVWASSTLAKARSWPEDGRLGQPAAA